MTVSRALSTTALRTVCVARAAWGLAFIVTPGAVLATGGGRNDRPGRTVLRVLGARHVAQAVIVAAGPKRQVQRLGVVVDVLHAASAVAFASVDHRQRRFALTETVTATLWATSGWILQRRTP